MPCIFKKKTVKIIVENKTLAAMSGGVDSSVAAWLLTQKGFDCIGAIMKLYTNDDIALERDNGCCTLADTQDARAVASKIGIPFYVLNFTSDFADDVINRFITAYKNGRTPNPCIDCNRYLKFERLLHRAEEIGCNYIATGHYAKIEYNNKLKRFLLKKGADVSKDQSYVLYFMKQEHLAHTLLPLGELTKPQVREIAQAQGFINARKKESQDICFVPNRDYADFIKKYTGEDVKKGRFKDIAGNDLGEHKGIINYTIGQRRGVGIAANVPVYVCALNPAENTVIIGEKENLYSKSLVARGINLIPFEKLDSPLKVKAKIRYRHSEEAATVTQIDCGSLRVDFDEPQLSITKGQAVVLYDDDVVIGGGTIEETEYY